jgi:hypothetical protein
MARSASQCSVALAEFLDLRAKRCRTPMPVAIYLSQLECLPAQSNPGNSTFTFDDVLCLDQRRAENPAQGLPTS